MSSVMVATIQAQIAALQKQLLALILTLKHVSMSGETIYKMAAQSLGKHMTLNEAIPAEVGCAEAVSAVLALAGIYDGPKGIAGTATLHQWLANSPLFSLVGSGIPQEGDIIISPTGAGNGSVEGHTGICGIYSQMYTNDWGILSNDSATGLFLECWSFARWNAIYGKSGGLPVYIFRAK